MTYSLLAMQQSQVDPFDQIVHSIVEFLLLLWPYQVVFGYYNTLLNLSVFYITFFI